MRKKTLVSLVSLALAAAALPAQAMDDRFYVSPMLNYAIPDDDRDADNGWGLGVAAGKMLTEEWNAELNLNYVGMSPHDYDLYGLGLDALYFFNRNPAFAPYLVLGVGYLKTDMSLDEDHSVMGNIGLGFFRQLTDNIDLRADARYRVNSNDLPTANDNGDLRDWLFFVGLNIALGAKAQPAPPPAPAAVAAPEPAPVKAEPVAPAPPPQAPAETQPAEVAPTPEVVGAQLEQAKTGDTVVVLKDVNFAFDSAELRPDALPILDEAVSVLKRREAIKVEIAGHACSIGTEEYNQALSERRARSVQDYLVSQGLDPKRFSTKAYGETRPLADNTVPGGRCRNRRVEMLVVE